VGLKQLLAAYAGLERSGTDSVLHHARRHPEDRDLAELHVDEAAAAELEVQLRRISSTSSS